FTPKDPERPEIHGGFANCYFVETPEVQELLKKLKVTIRCVPLTEGETSGTCLFTGQPTSQRGVFAKAY
ncbi:MAG TPA: proline--tRNA ligase, partial [Pirellulaceae bacterium]|nr:proline--tRNA ligase [Pirellulaceae bacterium]